MPRSSTERGFLHLVCALLAAVTAAGAQAQVMPFTPLRLMNVIDVSEHEDQVDLAILFNCSMRFVSAIPVSEGQQVHIQLAPLGDCGVTPLTQISSELPPISGGAGIISAARTESLAPGQVTLTIDFKKSERFVIAQGVDPRGLRLRLVDRFRGRAQIIVGQGADSVSNFAINLDSRPKPFSSEEVARAHERLKAPAFVSEATVEGVRWYRLRVGPIERRAEANRLLDLALADYPRAWLAIGDDAVTSDANVPVAAGLPAVERLGTDAPLPPQVQRQMLTDARKAMDAHDYPTAIALLTKLQRQPEYPDRARAQELLGLARERSGQLAHAKAEYEEYLRRYPQGEAADRVAFRLRILRAAEAQARTGRSTGSETDGWQLSGGFSQTGRYDGSRETNGSLPTNTPVPPAPQINENALFTDLDLLARRRGESYDWLGRLSAGYDKTFGQDTVAVIDPTRVSLASIEMLDRPLGLLARLGRQAYNQDGVLGTFDGLFVSWQFRPSWALNVAAGFPVEQLQLSPQTDERFETLALAYTPPGAHWDASVFVAHQQFQALTDREAVGANMRYLASNVSLVSVVDYDVFYHSLNTASLLGTVQLPARWSVSVDAERRNSPVLTTRNALIGQPYNDLTQLQQVATDEQIYQWAQDRTPVTTNYSLTASRPLGARYVLTGIVNASSTGATPASGGVPAVPASGTLMTYQLQLYASNLWKTGDFNVLTYTHSNTEIGTVDSISTNLRVPLGATWRIGPRFAVDRLSTVTDGSTATTYIPSLLTEYQHGRGLFQLDVGGEFGRREALLQLQDGAFVQTQNTTRYYVSLSYRIDFQR
jgi:tetratricopeptide (TPR) repeat protein